MWQKFKAWFDANKVFIAGMVSAVTIAAVTLSQDVSQEMTYKALGLAAFTAAVGYFAKNARGQAASIVGQFGGLFIAIYSLVQTHNISDPQLVVQLLILVNSWFMPDPKSRAYENTATIRQAKVEAEAILPAPLTSQDIKNEAKNL